MLNSLIHQRLGRYYIKELLGRGGMAAVYCATDTVLQRDVALKILYPHYTDDAGQLARFQREAVTAAALEHPQIVPIYDVGEHDGMAYIAMKLLNGRTLQERLQEAGAIDLAELLAVLEPVSAALDYAHSRGVIHRDIKPGNIFLSQSPDGQRVMLTDFGIAKQLDTPGLTTTGALIGTPDYMAPEQIAGRPIDARTDVYALGMLAFRALTGRRAFEGGTQDVLMGHLYQRPPRLSDLRPGLPPALDALVLKAIATDPAERFPSAGAFVRALAQAARDLAADTRAQAIGAGLALSAPPRRPAADEDQPPAVVQRPTPAIAAGTGPSSARHPSFAVAAPDPSASWRPAPVSVADQTTTTRPSPPRGSAAPWLLAVVLATIAGGLAVALGFLLLGRDGGAAAGGASPAPATTVPPTITLAPSPSPTLAPSPSADPAGGVAPPEPSQTSPPPTPAPPTPAPPRPIPPTATPEPTATATPEPSPTPTATATPAPSPTSTATSAPSPTSTATSAPSPTPTVIACADGLLQGGFGKLYASDVGVRQNLGCPRGPEAAGQAAIQFFERGTMYWWGLNSTELRDTVFVLYGLDGGTYELYPVDVVDGLPVPTPITQDPNEPKRGFGRVYFGVPDVRESLGLWISGEVELKGSRAGVIQFFDNGVMIFTPEYRKSGAQSIFVLYNTGTFTRFEDS